MRRRHYIVLGILIVALLAAAAAALFGPKLLRDRATAWVHAETGRVLTVGKININLLTLSVEIRDVALTEADQATPFVTWERLYVALSPRSLWHRAPVVRELLLDKPAVRLARAADGRFNFSDLTERKAAPAAASAEEEPAQFSLNNLEIRDGLIEFSDLALDKPVSHRIEGLQLAIPFLGNLPYLEDRYVEPLLRATVNGTPFELTGEVKPFADTREYLVKLKFSGIDLPYYLGYVREALPVAVNNGRLDVDLDLTYRASAASKPVLEVAGRIDLTALDLRERNGRPLLFVPLLETRLAPSQPLDRKLHLAGVNLHSPQVWIDRNPAGAWNVSRLGRSPAAAGEPPAKQTQDLPLQLRIDRLNLTRGRLELRDNLPAGGFATRLSPVDLAVEGFTLAEHTPFKAALNLASERQEQLAAQGQVTLSPLALDLQIKAAGLPLDAYRPYYQQQVAAAIGGNATASTRLQVMPGQPLLLSDSTLEVTGLELPLANGEGLRLARAALQAGTLDLAANRLEIGGLSFEQPDLRISRGRDGRWSFRSSYPILRESPSPPEPMAAAAETAARPFAWRIDRIALSGGQLAVRDELPAEPAQFTVTGLGATVRDLAAPEKVAGSFEVQGQFQKRGQFQASGTVVPAGPEIKASLRLQRIPLTAFAPYLAERVRLVLVDGTLDTQLTAAVARQGETWRGHFGGNLGIGRFYCLDAEHREDLLRWERLQIGGIDGRLDPFALKIGAVALHDYYARVLLDEQARLNFADLIIKAPDASGESPAVAAVAPPATTAIAPAKPEIRIGKITLQGGKVSFTDRHLPKPFSAEMLQLGGRIEGLSSTPGTLAEVDLRGRLRNESPLTIAGTLNLLADPLFLDLKLDFTDIELSPLSPYSGTYVGYLIERGKLNVGLAYHVENGRLNSSNQLFIDQFTFGDKVESDKATSLPVRLAVALLKDRKGEIHLDIPVSGDINDPQFSIWGVVWQIIRNLLVKAATSPLALLGALAGGGEDFSAIVFPAGSAALTEAEHAKLQKIADALRERADLKIEVKGYVDPDNDPEGYRRELLQAKIRREKLIDLRKSQGDAAPADADAVKVTPEESPEYLWRVYKAADFPKPRNLVGMVKHLPDAELEKLLLAHTKIGAEELTTLAQARARTVIAALTETGGIPRERVFLAATEIAAKPTAEGISRSRVEFGIAVQ